MQDKHHIDQLFKHAFSEYKEKAPENAWEKIELALPTQHKERPMWFFLRVAASIVLLLGLGAGGFFYLNNMSKTEVSKAKQENVEKNIELKNSKITTNDENGSSRPSSATRISETKPLSSLKKHNPEVVEKSSTLVLDKGSKSVSSDRIKLSDKHQSKIRKTTTSSNSKLLQKQDNQQYYRHEEISRKSVMAGLQKIEELTGIFDVRIFDFAIKPEIGKQPYTEEIAMWEEKENVKRVRRWNIMLEVSPIFSKNIIGKGISSSFQESNFYNHEKELYSPAGAIKAAFNISSSLSIGTGLSYSKMGQRLDNIVIYNSYNHHKAEQNFYIQTSAGKVSLRKFPATLSQQLSPAYTVNGPVYAGMQYNKGEDVQAAFFAKENEKLELSQSFEFLEIPLYLQWNFIQAQKLGVGVQAGASWGYLISNKTLFEDKKGMIDIGSTADMQKYIISGELSLNLSYKINSSFDLSLRPSFKYTMHSLSKDPFYYYRPYNIGIFTGINMSL